MTIKNTAERTDKIKIGDVYKINRGNNKLYKIHILTIIDEHQVVFKWYGRHKQWWHYEIKPIEILEIEIERANGE